MQRQARAGLVAIDETGIGSELREARACRSPCRELAPARRHRRPRPAAAGIDALIAIAPAIGYPSGASTVGHGDGHALAAGGLHVAPRIGGNQLLHIRAELDRFG